MEKLEIHRFGDASGEGLCAAVCTVATQLSGVTQELLVSKARLVKKGLTIPRLELVASHMVTNLVTNASRALSHILHEKHCWSDSTVALFIVDQRRRSIQTVRGKSSSKDSRCSRDRMASCSRRDQLTELWLKGPTWLRDRSCWPSDLVLQPSADSQSECKAT